MITEEEDIIIHKKWFLAEPFMKKFLPKGWDKDEAKRLGAALGLQRNRLAELMTPGYLISERMADTYAVRMRISSSQHMA